MLYLQYWAQQKKSDKILKLNDKDIFTERINRQKKMNQILDKVTEVGWDGLSSEDQAFLKEQSSYYQDANNPN